MVKRLSLCEKRDKEMNKREALGDSSIHLSVLGVYKGIETAIRNSGLMARFYGTRTESWGIVIFENGAVREANN